MVDKEIAEMLQQGHRDLAWFHEHFEEFKQRYPDRYIALSDCRIVSVEKDLEVLNQMIKRSGVDRARVLIEYIPTLDVVLSPWQIR